MPAPRITLNYTVVNNMWLEATLIYALTCLCVDDLFGGFAHTLSTHGFIIITFMCVRPNICSPTDESPKASANASLLIINFGLISFRYVTDYSLMCLLSERIPLHTQGHTHTLGPTALVVFFVLIK